MKTPVITTDEEGEAIYSVSAINAQASQMLEQAYPSVSVEGEISDLIKHRSGHWYFTLKDQNAMLRAAMFRGQNQRLRFSPENGHQVIVGGRLTVYAARGSYQLVAATMKPAGEGELLRQFVELKAELESLGWFDPARKKPLPTHPRQIAIVTSAQGAALRDMQTTFARRNPGIALLLVPVSVQGPGASTEIANAVARLNQLSQREGAEIKPDAIIIGRGGGSLEDLWAFNERNLARAVVESQLPVVSAVGHETDFTIADLVADLRAPTPTAAAELLSEDRKVRLANAQAYSEHLYRLIGARLADTHTALKNLQHRLRSPSHRLQEQAQSLDHLDARLLANLQRRFGASASRSIQLTTALRGNTPSTLLQKRQHQLSTSLSTLKSGARQLLNDNQNHFQTLTGKLHAISPLATLSRGYTVTSDQNNRILSSISQVKPGQAITTRFADGTMTSNVLDARSDAK